MKVTLRPLVTSDTQWAGVKNYKNCYEDLGPYFTRSGTIYTGLTKDIADRLGEKLGLDLNPGSEYWTNFYIRTAGKDIIFNLEEPMDELKYQFLKNHKRVKNSLSEHKATANFVLMNQEEESQRTNLFNRLKRDAVREFDKMSPEEMRKALRVFGKSSEELSPEIVENRLFDIVEGDPSGFLEKWAKNTNRETQWLVERAVSMNVIRKNKRIYNYGSDTIGHGLEDTILYLDDPKNQDVRIAIKQSIEGKGKIEAPVAVLPDPIVNQKRPTTSLTLTPVEEVKDAIKE